MDWRIVCLWPCPSSYSLTESSSLHRYTRSFGSNTIIASHDLNAFLVKLVLHVVYPPEYPDVYPNVSLDELEGEDREGMNLTTEEKTQLLQSLEEVVRPFVKSQLILTNAVFIRERRTSLQQ